MQILTDPHPLLHKVCRPDFVVSYDIITQMFTTMRLNNGVGLAAPQVGIDARLFITAWGGVFVNPEIVERSGEIESFEGCLSLPGVVRPVSRSSEIRLATGEVFTGLQAIVIQHEMNHLDGILITDKPL